MQRDVERERRKRCVAAQNPSGEEEAPMLRRIALEGEVGREQAHYERSGDVLEQRCKRKRRTEQARRGQVDAMTQRRTEATAQKDNQKAHSSLLSKPGRKKNRPARAVGSDRIL